MEIYGKSFFMLSTFLFILFSALLHITLNYCNTLYYTTLEVHFFTIHSHSLNFNASVAFLLIYTMPQVLFKVRDNYSVLSVDIVDIIERRHHRHQSVK